jgi:hypothetical protein
VPKTFLGVGTAIMSARRLLLKNKPQHKDGGGLLENMNIKRRPWFKCCRVASLLQGMLLRGMLNELLVVIKATFLSTVEERGNG